MVSSHIFISYSHEDYAFVQQLVRDLQTAKIHSWIDQHIIKVGTPSWDQAIRSAIRDCYAVILIASPYSGMSRYVRGELHIAEMYQKPVFPIWIAGDEWVECVPMALIEMQYSDARGSNYQSALEVVHPR